VEGSVDADVLPAYSFVQPELKPNLAWQVDRHLSLRASYRLRYFRLLSGSADLSEILDAPPGTDPNAPYFLSTLQQGVVYDGRNDPVRTTRGGYWELQFAQAGGPLGGAYRFVRATGEFRAYRSLTRILGWDPDAVLAGRIAGGAIHSGLGDDVQVVPVNERLYLGGGTSVRGWAADRLGPWEEVTNDAGDPEIVPVGGMLRLQANMEARKQLPYDVDLAGFVDVGRAWRKWGDLTPDSLQWSVGGGLRYATSIGPVRVDVARRLGSDERFDFYPRWAVHFGLSEAF
jgi:translocation and assembly module TamA